MLVFYSPSEIVSLVGTFPGINGHPKIATFGHGTTNTAIGEGLTVSVMAPSPEAPSMTRAIELYLKKDQRRRNGRSGSARRTIAGPGLHPGAGGQTR